MNFIGLRVLNVLKNEEAAFWVMLHIMKEKDWKSIYSENTPKLIRSISELVNLIKKSLPKIYKHFESLDVNIYNLFL